MKRFIIGISLLLAAFTHPVNVMAQQTQPTHAHATSRVWHGIDVDNIPETDYLAPSTESPGGKKIYLFNVGTGRFVIEGGNFGMEGRLFHQDFGRPLYLQSDGFIKSGITEQTNATKIMFGCNVPGVSNPNGQWSQYGTYSFTIMMDVNSLYLGRWNFQRVETDPNAETYTYYMWETMKSKNYYLGAA